MWLWMILAERLVNAYCWIAHGIYLGCLASLYNIVFILKKIIPGLLSEQKTLRHSFIGEIIVHGAASMPILLP
jgi:hypothetical protein